MVSLATHNSFDECKLINQDTFLEQTWGAILSREKDEIQRAFNELDRDSRKAVLDHLHKMASEYGWHPEQVESARIALSTIRNRDL